MLAHGRWFSPGTSASSTTKNGRHDIAEILLKVALNTINQSINHQSVNFVYPYVIVEQTLVYYYSSIKFYIICACVTRIKGHHVATITYFNLLTPNLDAR